MRALQAAPLLRNGQTDVSSQLFLQRGQAHTEDIAECGGVMSAMSISTGSSLAGSAGTRGVVKSMRMVSDHVRRAEDMIMSCG